MAKKSRRVRKKGRPVRLSQAQMAQPGADQVVSASPNVFSATPASQESDLREEYHYVVADLKRIGVIALVMLVALIALALLLT